MTEEQLRTIANPTRARFTDRGSRFYALAFPVMGTREIEIRRSQTAEKYPDATHHCYACRYNPFQPVTFVQDDGEPSGTAGLPILGAIKSASLVNILVIVVRYYGGTKLGKSGLIHAYRQTAALCLESVGKVMLDRFLPFSIQYPYDSERRIRELVRRYRLETDSERYMENISMNVFCPLRHSAQLHDALQQLEHLGVSFIAEPECFRPVTNPGPR